MCAPWSTVCAACPNPPGTPAAVQVTLSGVTLCTNCIDNYFWRLDSGAVNGTWVLPHQYLPESGITCRYLIEIATITMVSGGTGCVGPYSEAPMHVWLVVGAERTLAQTKWRVGTAVCNPAWDPPCVSWGYIASCDLFSGLSAAIADCGVSAVIANSITTPCYDCWVVDCSYPFGYGGVATVVPQ